MLDPLYDLYKQLYPSGTDGDWFKADKSPSNFFAHTDKATNEVMLYSRNSDGTIKTQFAKDIK